MSDQTGSRRVAGREYLELATSLLQAARLSSPDSGLWEAADLQWWWRKDQHRDPERQVAWFESGTPVAVTALTDLGDRFQLDLFELERDDRRVREEMWPVAVAMIASLSSANFEVHVRHDDYLMAELARSVGFESSDDSYTTTSLASSALPDQSRLPQGFVLRSWADGLRPRHPMVERNGEKVAELLAECSLYDPRLDLAVYTDDGEVAGYGLFWADPVTRVGLVEPMRTEDRFQGMGIARHVLTAGLGRLADDGCTRLRITHSNANERSTRLYRGVGFSPDFVTTVFERRAGA